MISRGIPASMITTDAKGESEPRVPTLDGERNPQNRRVEITIR
jgi:outer membrane protein OmpA-like peptidoglycan-associated protein